MDVYARIKECVGSQLAVNVVTVIDGAKSGQKLLVFADGSVEGDLQLGPLADHVIADARAALDAARSETRSYDASAGEPSGQLLVYLESIVPPPWLIIVGAGHTSIPLAGLAKICGFKVTLIDARAAFANRIRFKDPDEILVEWPHLAIARMQLNESTHVAVLTHDEKFEHPLLPLLLRSRARYIGVIGSRKTQRARRERLLGEGFSDADIARLSGPIGMDIGAVTPEEIALSILAEIVAKQHGRSGGFLTDRLKDRQ